MIYFTHILLNNVIPLGIMISLGIGMQRIFKLDIRTFSKLIFYLFTPVQIFKMIYESSLSSALLLQCLLFIVLFLLGLFLVTLLAVRLRGHHRGGMKSAMMNSVLFYNSGNYAIPLNQLVFAGDAFTMSVQMIVMMVQALIPNTYGVYSVNAHKMALKDTMRTIAGMPIIYAIPFGFLMRGFQVSIPGLLYEPITYIADAYTALALLTLGVQLGQMKWVLDRWTDLAISNVLRLVAGPAIGFGIVLLLGIHGMMAKALVLSCAVPTSLSSVLLAVEFDNEPEFSSQAVFSSTVLSIFTVSVVIYLLQFIP